MTQYLEERQGFPVKLNIGCGRDVRDGWVNADLYPYDNRVKRIDADCSTLNLWGWPYPDCTFTQIDAMDLIEHLRDPMRFLAECWRVLQPGGRLTATGPHFTSRDVHTDLTHRRSLSSETFLWASGRGWWVAPLAIRWRKVHVELDFEWWNGLFVGWTNLSQGLMRFYEATPLRMFPAKRVRAQLVK